MNIEKCLDYYSESFNHEFWSIDSQIVDENVLRRQALDFLRHYAMSDSEYKDLCTPVMQTVFRFSLERTFKIGSMALDEMFEDGFEYFSYNSSPLFWKESYELLMKVCMEYGDKNIFIVEEESCEKDPEVAFKIKIPVGKSWEEISKGGYITDVLFNMPNHNYYVLGDSGMWGKWCDYDNRFSDYETFCFKRMSPVVLEYKDYFSEYITEQLVPEKKSKGLSGILRQLFKKK